MNNYRFLSLSDFYISIDLDVLMASVVIKQCILVFRALNSYFFFSLFSSFSTFVLYFEHSSSVLIHLFICDRFVCRWFNHFVHCVSFSHRRDSYIHIHDTFRNKNLHKLNACKCYLIKLVIDNGHHFEMNTIVREEHKNKSKSSTNFGLLKTLFRNSVTKSKLYVFYGRTIFMDDFNFKQVISIEYYPKIYVKRPFSKDNVF